MKDGILGLYCGVAMCASVYAYVETDYAGWAALAVVFCVLGAFHAARAIKGGR